MNYKFPIINTIEDVLPHIEGRSEFLVVEKEGYTAINYVVNKDDTFNISEDNPTEGAIRRECRGLIFDTSGRIISRPFHKFFNLGEREDTQPSQVDITQPHIILEKLDGSMIRPLVINGYLRLATKAGITDVAMQAEEYLVTREDHSECVEWMLHMDELGLTPIFEFISPENQIVLEYEKADLVLLAIRRNSTGDYVSTSRHKWLGCPFNTVANHGSITNKSLTSFASEIKEGVDNEGIIIRFDDGQMIKVKNEWYVRIHKVKDLVRTERNVIALIVNNELDDVIPLVTEKDVEKIKTTQNKYFKAFDAKLNQIEEMCETVIEKYGNDRKSIALEYLPNTKDKMSGRFVFSYLDGQQLNEVLLRTVESNLSSNTKWEKFAEWLGM